MLTVCARAFVLSVGDRKYAHTVVEKVIAKIVADHRFVPTSVTRVTAKNAEDHRFACTTTTEPIAHSVKGLKFVYIGGRKVHAENGVESESVPTIGAASNVGTAVDRTYVFTVVSGLTARNVGGRRYASMDAESTTAKNV